MKRWWLALWAFLTVVGAQAQQPKEKSVLWKIERSDLPAASYLFGTFHLLCPNDFTLPDTVKKLLSESKQLYLEIATDDPNMTTKMVQHIAMKNGVTLKDLFSAKTYDSLASLFQQKTHIPLSAVAHYKPFVLSSLLYPSIMGCTPVAFEKVLEQLAHKDSIGIKGLETIEDQMAVFDTIPYKVQAKMLSVVLNKLFVWN